MADESLIARLMAAAEDDPTIYAALQQYYQNSAPLDEVLVDCILILSAQLKAANQAHSDTIARNAHPHWPEPRDGYGAIAPGGDMETD